MGGCDLFPTISNELEQQLITQEIVQAISTFTAGFIFNTMKPAVKVKLSFSSSYKLSGTFFVLYMCRIFCRKSHTKNNKL